MLTLSFSFIDNAQVLPQLDPQQELKLKQLTVMTLAETAKVYFCIRSFTYVVDTSMLPVQLFVSMSDSSSSVWGHAQLPKGHRH